MVRRVLVAAIAALTAMVMMAPGAAAAVRPFDPAVTVVGGCAPGRGDAVVTSFGSVRGFVDCPSSVGPRIRFFSRASDGTVRPSESTGFSGTVLGVAYDATATYVLFYTDSNILIGKRTNAGVYSFRAVDSWSGVAPPTGDIIARSGQWFGVWSKQVGPGGEFAQTELFQAGSAYRLRRITNTAASIDDGEPSLAYTNNGTVPLLVWTRAQAPELPGPSDLRVAKFIGGAWQSRLFASLGNRNYSPDVQVRGRFTFVTWGRDGRIVVASNRLGAFASHTFNTPGFQPKVAASVSAGAVDHVFVTWTVPGDTDAGNRVFFAEAASDGFVTGVLWEGTYITGPGTAAFGIGAFAGKATVAYRSETAVYVRSQS
jgi:hypothetical protein